MSRIAATFEKLKSSGKKALIPFVTAGDPDPQMTTQIMRALVEAGADIIELGVPFSDPMADGPTIQRSSERALVHGVGLGDVLGFVAEFRKSDDQTPVVLMGYANPIEAMGLILSAEAAAAFDELTRTGDDDLLVRQIKDAWWVDTHHQGKGHKKRIGPTKADKLGVMDCDDDPALLRLAREALIAREHHAVRGTRHRQQLAIAGLSG